MEALPQVVQIQQAEPAVQRVPRQSLGTRLKKPLNRLAAACTGVAISFRPDGAWFTAGASPANENWLISSIKLLTRLARSRIVS